MFLADIPIHIQYSLGLCPNNPLVSNHYPQSLTKLTMGTESEELASPKKINLQNSVVLWWQAKTGRADTGEEGGGGPAAGQWLLF